jgi:hypothetical protein
MRRRGPRDPLNKLHRLPASSTVYDFQVFSLLSDGVCNRFTSLLQRGAQLPVNLVNPSRLP